VASSTNAAGATPNASGKFVATIFPGDGIGPEISKAVMQIFEVRFAGGCGGALALGDERAGATPRRAPPAVAASAG
jgi:hypothetical protein